ncbi:MAG: ketoisovalerate oxidoreductase [Syntrophomonadaceae bacterium]|jgi:2-oxoglutarate ferredoxin oxidoreductase subunit gamma|nr:ketoisovalerate oxidoreductase [Syntrophomonadaceae bacterium]
MRLVRVVLAGEGGQGVQSAAEIMAEAAYEEGKQTIYIPNFGLEQRGGVSIAFLQVGDRRIGAPKFNKADVVAALSQRAMARTRIYSGPDTIFMYDSSFEVTEEDLPTQYNMILDIPAVEKSKELNTRVFNVIIMGAVLELTAMIPVEATRNALEKKLGYKFEKNPELREMNYRAMEVGRALVRNRLKGGEMVCASTT